MTGSSDHSLPAGYESLERFVAGWALPTLPERAHRRDTSSPEERQALFDAFKGSVNDALDMLDRKPQAELTPAEQRLLDLALSFAHVALAVEVQGEAEAQLAASRLQTRLQTVGPA